MESELRYIKKMYTTYTEIMRWFHIFGQYGTKIDPSVMSQMSQRWGYLAHIFMLESILTCSVVNRAQIATHLACICLKTLKCSYTYTRSSNV